MSSFEENFEGSETKNAQFDTTAFYPVLETFIIFMICYTSYKIYSLFFKFKVKYQDQKKYRNCQCKSCKQRLNNLIKKKTNNQELIFYFGALSFFILSFSICYKKIEETKSKIKSFNPFDILEISSSATNQEIRKAYKKLAIKYHPDKNLNNLQAKAKFMLVTKAYESLTNEEAKRNYELYGNPDGPGAMRFSIGLPGTLILNKKNQFKFIILFIFIVCIIIPYEFFKWFRKSQSFDENGLLYSTIKSFKRKTNNESKINYIPFWLGSSIEFRWIEDPDLEKTKIEIEELFNKYKTEFPKGTENLKVNLINKKSIGIAYAYSYGDRENKNYLKLTKVNEYLFLIAKLIDTFYEGNKEKYFSPNKSEEIEFPRITREFFNSIKTFQQCFYQGIPIQKIVPNISYAQLPYINTENIHLIEKSDENINFKKFLKKNDENKKIFLKKIFNFTDEQILEIIEATHSIPQYEYKVKHYVEGFENTDIILNDIVTFNITIIRKNVGKLQLGIGHSKFFPGFFNECIYFDIIIGNTLVSQERVHINKKETHYKFPIKMGVVGKILIKFIASPACSYAQNEEIESTVECIAKSQRRKELMDLFKKRKEELPLSLIQQILKEQGVKVYSDSEDEEEEEEVVNNNKEEKEKNEIK